MKGVEKFEVEIVDKADNKEAVIDAVIRRYHVCEEVADALIQDSLCTVKGLEFLFNDIDQKLERRDLR